MSHRNKTLTLACVVMLINQFLETFCLMIMMMMITTTTIIIIIIIVSLERLSLSNMLNCAEQVQVQKIKHMHARHSKQHVSKQSCSNIQLSSKDG